jgi:hypothetical protein
VTGSGEVRLVVHDALGREQIVTLPLYFEPGAAVAWLSRATHSRSARCVALSVGAATTTAICCRGDLACGRDAPATAELHAEGVRAGAHAAGVDVAAAIGRLGVLAASPPPVATVRHGLAGGRRLRAQRPSLQHDRACPGGGSRVSPDR